MIGMANSTRHTGRWTLEDRFASPWHYLPVDVPAGTAGLRVELDYDRAGGAVLDLGCLGPHGFRGWSGGARESFVISRAAATPGYLPGEVEAGTWQVMIGVHRVPPDGVRYRLTAQTAPPGAALEPPPAPPAPPVPRDRPPRRVLPARPGRRWLAGDLHTHTVHSDGALTVPELAALAAGRGLDFLAVTDHNTVSHHAELAAAARRYGITLLPGQEVTTDGGHAGALGDVGWIDFRREPDAWLDATEAAGGLLSVNHPFAGPVSWTRPMRRRPPLLEVWHWSWLDLRWTPRCPGGWPGIRRRSRSAAATGTSRDPTLRRGARRPGSSARGTTRVTSSTACGRAGWPFRPNGMGRCCCATTATSSPSTPTV